MTFNGKQKLQCECGGSYSLSNKATHVKTKKHMKYLEQQKEQENSKFNTFRKDLAARIGFDVYEYLGRDDITDEQWFFIDEIQQYIPDPDEWALFCDSQRVCEHKWHKIVNIGHWENMGEKDRLEGRKKYPAAARDLETTLKGKTIDEQIKWFNKMTKDFKDKKARINMPPSEWKILCERLNYVIILENGERSKETRRKEAEILEQEVNEILERNPELKCLLD